MKTSRDVNTTLISNVKGRRLSLPKTVPDYRTGVAVVFNVLYQLIRSGTTHPARLNFFLGGAVTQRFRLMIRMIA